MEIGARLGTAATVKGLPFTATYEAMLATVEANQMSLNVMRGTVRRSNEGLLFISHEMCGPDGQAIDSASVIKNAAVNEMIVLLPSRRVAIKDELTGFTTAYDELPYIGSAVARAGIRCRQVDIRQGASKSRMDEIWVSEELRVVLFDREVTEARVKLWQVIALEQVEPDAAIFEIPKEFQLTTAEA